MLVYKGKFVVPGGDPVEVHMQRKGAGVRIAVRSGDGWRWAMPAEPGALESNVDDRIARESQVIREMVRERDAGRSTFEKILGRRIDPNERTESIALEIAAMADGLRGILARERVGPFDPNSIEAYHEAITERAAEVPGVVRVHRPHPLLLRAMVAEETSPEIAGATREAVVQVVADSEVKVIVQVEPGDLPDGYEIREDMGCDGDSPDPGPFPVYAGSPPTEHWLTYEWVTRSPDGSFCGAAFRSKARAIDDAWEDYTADLDGEEAEDE